MVKLEYPETANDCEEDFEEDGIELMCGKRNVWGEWILCPKCRKLPENKKFKKAHL